jgi:hypothetical protein
MSEPVPAPEPGEVNCSLEGSRAHFRTSTVAVTVDALHHDLFLTGIGSNPLRLAASRRGLGEAVQVVDAVLGQGLLSQDAIEGYVMDALIVAARRQHVLVDEAFTAVDVIQRTPLVCCRGVVSNRHLMQDIVRFVPAAVAVSRIEEDDLTDASAPERTELWADQLSRWRELYCAPGSTQRSVNRTLAQFGDEASADALWGLRRIPIDAPLPSVQHLEVLGCLGNRHTNIPGRPVDVALHEAIVRATATELGTALVLIDEGEFDRVVFGRDPPAMRLAEILSVVPIEGLREALDRRVRFQDLLEHAIHALQRVLKLNAQTIEPPIALPRTRGVHFLATIGDILKEGVEMDHCVATRAPRALAGSCYLFHVDHGGHRATVEVDSNGSVLEARGPSNVDNPAVPHGAAALAVWGAPLRFAALGDASTSLWALPGPPLPSGTEAVQTLGEFQHIVTALLTPPETGDGTVVRWCLGAAERARLGQCWLVVHRAAGVPFELSRIDDDGTVHESTTSMRADAADHGGINGGARPGEQDGGMPEDWDWGT